ncbi:MAG: nucleotidyltransferase [Agathobacter sp.]|nr:nucleotidyltransferase [Agathobacter sp.]
MKVVGIVAEYNPFHNGHKYQIEKIKSETKADAIIVAMSGNFLQRGVPACCDKFTRTEMALRCGVDLVLEIPTIWATASAEYYAHAGVLLLAATGVVTHLCFGAETDDLATLTEISSILKDEPDAYKSQLSIALRSGISFPIARKQALKYALSHIRTEKLDAILDHPNNILALEYLKALPTTIEPILIKREGAGYHDTEINIQLPSASAIRKTLFDSASFIDAIKNAMPKEAFDLLKESYERNELLCTNDFSESLGYCLMTQAEIGFSAYADCNVDLSNKIKKGINNYTFFENFIDTLKTKDMTYTRVSRCLLHILLGIKQSDYALSQTIGFAPYLRILGFKKDATNLLSEIKKASHIPILSKVADAGTLLLGDAKLFFEKDVYASNLYYQHSARKSKAKPKNEFTNQIVIL